MKLSHYVYLGLAAVCFGVTGLSTNANADTVHLTTSGLFAGNYQTKRFHGYRIEAKNYVHYNTEYNVKQHLILSKYRPTQKSKVVFKYGTRIVPTRHPWIWHHGKNDNQITMYRYSKGAWHQSD